MTPRRELRPFAVITEFCDGSGMTFSEFDSIPEAQFHIQKRRHESPCKDKCSYRIVPLQELRKWCAENEVRG